MRDSNAETKSLLMVIYARHDNDLFVWVERMDGVCVCVWTTDASWLGWCVDSRQSLQSPEIVLDVIPVPVDGKTWPWQGFQDQRVVPMLTENFVTRCSRD